MPQQKRYGGLLNFREMKSYNRNLLVLTKAPSISDEEFEKQLETLHKIFLSVETNEAFCTAHELVARNKITCKAKKILQAITELKSKSFYFLINKN
jgi:hypothetical protein